MNDDAPTQNALQNVIAQAQKADGGSDGLPPVHLWEPDYCGDIGLHIARDGQWYYAGSPIGRKRLVRLFSKILRHDDDGEHYLVTPVEKIRVEVEDAPFVATLMQVTGSGRDQVLSLKPMSMTSPPPGPNTRCASNWIPRTKLPRPIFTFARALKRSSAVRCFTTLWPWAKRLMTSSGCGAKMFFPDCASRRC